ncbi:MAG: histidine kinase [Terriglobales bacterium]
MKHRFLPRLAVPSDTTEWLRTERVLASARVFLTLTAMIAVYLDSTEPTRYAGLAYAILDAYVLWAVVVWAILRREITSPSFADIVHLLDIVFPIVFMLFTAGPNSPFFSFLLFVLTAAAFRWGLPKTVITSVIVTVLIIAEAVILSYGPQHWLAGQFEVNRFVIRISYLLTLGILVGYLGEEEKRWRAENATITRLLAKINSGGGLRAGIESLFDELLRIFSAREALIVLIESETKRIYTWRQQNTGAYARSVEVEPGERRAYDIVLPADAMFAQSNAGRWKCWAVDANGRPAPVGPGYDPGKTMPEMEGSSAVLAANLRMGEEWTGYVLLRDGITGPKPADELRFVQSMIQQIAPALYSVFLIRRLRSRAGAIERARVARELHDGAIQTMIGVEMELDVLRRQAEKADRSSAVTARMQHVQEVVRNQVFDLRMLMQQMKPLEFRPGQVLDHMADLVDRFRRDTGIGAQFVTTLEDAEMPSRMARELVRMLQEALVNARKHSGATLVQVRFAAEDGCWKMGIVDNGRGFEFSGRMTLNQLDAARLGPGIIKERVRSLGGEMTVESTPGTGSEIWISVRQKAYTTHG